MEDIGTLQQGKMWGTNDVNLVLSMAFKNTLEMS